MVEVNIKFYNIERCGYYKPRNIEPVLSNTENVFSQLNLWAQQVNIQDSSTFDPPDNSTINKSYLLKMIQSDSGDYYITMWNAVPTTDANAVAAVSANSTHEQLEFQFQEFTEGYIPGFATYFWISPRNNRLATIRFNRSNNGQQTFVHFMQGFIKRFTSYVVQVEDNSRNIVTVSGYEEIGEEKQKLVARFKTKGLTKRGPIEFIRENLAKVWKVKGRTLIIPGSEERTSLLKQLINILAGENRNEINEQITMKFEFPRTPSREEFEAMYENWTENREGNEDVGFSIGNNDYWFGHEIQKTDIKLDVGMDNAEVYSLENIMTQVERNKEKIVRNCIHEVS